MHPPVPQGMTRNTPPSAKSTLIAGCDIPADTIVSVQTYTVQRDERYFVNPDSWIPERWTTKSDLVKDKRAWIPFSIGPFNCVGKYFALMESKIFLAKVVCAFNICLPEGDDGRNLMEENKDYLTWWCPDFTVRLIPK